MRIQEAVARRHMQHEQRASTSVQTAR
ncbi:Protein of unknown function [Propionibacterium freudenreichii]|nr:Protein of unknown function [Propionibacterium freudenreichii]